MASLEKLPITHPPGKSHFAIGTLFVRVQPPKSRVRLTTHDKEAFWLAGEDHKPLLLTTK